MKWFGTAVLFLLLGVAIGWRGGMISAEKKLQNSKPVLFDMSKATPIAVDCYDAQGNRLPNPFEKFGGHVTACAPGQTAKLHEAK